MATGALQLFMQECVHMSTMELEAEIAHVQPRHRANALSDFTDGHRHFMFVFSVKQAFWGEVPHKLLGLCHANETIAVTTARQCLTQWEDIKKLHREADAMGQSHMVHTHLLCTLFLDESMPLRQSLLTFANGTSRADPALQSLVAEIARLQIVPVVSRAIEGRLAVLKRLLTKAPSSSAPTCTCWRMPAS